MADLATPSAASMSTMAPDTQNSNGTESASKPAVTRPEKPDEDAFKAAVEKARKALTDAQEHTKAAQAKVNTARPSKDSPENKHREELRAQLGEIRTKQQGFKSTRNGTQDKIKALDTQLKSRIQEQKNAKAKIPFRNVEELDQRIQSLQKEVDTGKMKLVDEKKSLTEISSLNKQRRAFSGLDDSEKAIGELKTQIADLRKELDNPEYKALSDQYTAITTELDSLKATQDAAFKDLNTSRDALTASRKAQDEKYTALKKLQDEYYAQRRAYMDYDREANRQRAIKRKQEQEKYFIDKKRKDLDRDLEDAAYPAYADQLRSCDNLIRLLDPTSAKTATSTVASAFAAVASRVVDATGIKGTPLNKKNVDEEEYFMGGGGKKGKKNKNNKRQQGLGGDTVQQTDAAPANVDLGKFFDPAVVQQFEVVGLTPPSSHDEVEKVLGQLKEKKTFWQGDQKRKTQENVDAIQKRIDKLMAGEEDDETPAAAESSKANGVAPVVNGAAAESNPATEEDPELAEMKAMAAEDGSAEESNTAPLGDQDGAAVDGSAEIVAALEAASINGGEKVEA